MAPERLDDLSAEQDSLDSRVKATENYINRLDGAAKKRLTTERAKEMKAADSE